MIIDEGFLSNAKKIASTQSKSEVKAPVIRRENFDFNIRLYITEDSITDKKIRNLISSCIIFKETGEIKITEENNSDSNKIVSFDADLFITMNSIYEFLTSFAVYSDILIRNSKGEIIYKSKYTAETLYPKYFFNKSIIDTLTFEYHIKTLFEAFKCFGIPQKYIYRWMVLNGIIIITDSSNFSKNGTSETFPAYPVEVNDMDEFINIILSEEYSSIFLYNILEQTNHFISNKKGILIKNSGINKFIIYYDNNFDIIIQTMYPVVSEGFNDYISFKIMNYTISLENIYMQLCRLISQNNDKKLIVNGNEKDTIDIDFIEFNGSDNQSSRRYEVNIIYDHVNNPYMDSEKIYDSIMKCGLFSNKENASTSKIESGTENKYKHFICLDSDMIITADSVFNFISSFRVPNMIELYIKDRENQKNPLCFKMKLNKIVKRNEVTDSESISIYRIIMKHDFSLTDDEIVKFETNNGIVKTQAESQDNYKHLKYGIHLDSAERIKSIMKDIKVSYMNKYDRNSCSNDHMDMPETMMKFLDDNDIHEYILDIKSYEYSICVRINTLYPLYWKNSYVYPQFYTDTKIQGKYSKEMINHFEMLKSMLSDEYIIECGMDSRNIKFFNMDEIL